MYHRRLINPFLHFILSKCTKYEIVSWMVLRDTFGNTGTNLHTTILHTNALQLYSKPSGENRILSFHIRLLLCRQYLYRHI